MVGLTHFSPVLTLAMTKKEASRAQLKLNQLCISNVNGFFCFYKLLQIASYILSLREMKKNKRKKQQHLLSLGTIVFNFCSFASDDMRIICLHESLCLPKNVSILYFFAQFSQYLSSDGLTTFAMSFSSMNLISGSSAS